MPGSCSQRRSSLWFSSPKILRPRRYERARSTQLSTKSSTGFPLSTDWYTTHPPRLVCLTRSLIGIWFSSHRKTTAAFRATASRSHGSMEWRPTVAEVKAMAGPFLLSVAACDMRVCSSGLRGQCRLITGHGIQPTCPSACYHPRFGVSVVTSIGYRGSLVSLI